MTRDDPRASALDLYWLADHHDDLLEARLRGTPRPWRQPAQLDPERKAERDEQARIERAERDDHAIGEHPAPLHLDTLDVLVDVLHTAETVADRVAQAAGVDRLPPADHALADPRPYLRHAARWLRHTDPRIALWAEHEAARLRTTVAVTLGEVTDGQTLDAPCPWCGDERARTLRVRTLAGDLKAVVCHGVCEPSDADCGTWWRGRPAWPLSTEGDWLAARLTHAAGAA